MRRALGAWEGPAARYQVKLKIARDAGWASYCTKRSWLARLASERSSLAMAPGPVLSGVLRSTVRPSR